MEERFLTVQEVSSYLRLRPLSIYRMVKERKIPFRKAGRSIRFVKAEIDKWMLWGKA